MPSLQTYDHPGQAERAASFVRASLLFSRVGGSMEWPVDLDILPTMIAAEQAGSQEPDADRCYEIVLECGCPVDRKFFDLVFYASENEKEYVADAMSDIVAYGAPAIGDRERPVVKDLRCEPLAIVAAAAVVDAVSYARNPDRGSEGPTFILPASVVCADMLPVQENDVEIAVTMRSGL